MKRDKLTPAMLDKMSPEDRKRYDPDYLQEDPMPIVKPINKFNARLEKDEHVIFQNWLNLHNYPFIHSRTDKKTSQNLGVPDFIVFKKCVFLNKTPIRSAVAQSLMIEFKVQSNTMSEVQALFASLCEGQVWVFGKAVDAIELVFQQFGS